MHIVRKGEAGYDDLRRISNARFNYEPAAIAICSCEEDVVEAIRLARKEGCGIRVRAGGHHHEGMCSGGDDVWMIDVSHLDEIKMDPDKFSVTVGPGAKLSGIYDTVLPAGMIFPGGACGDVHIGGLVQGGGWGLFSRARGLTCDSLQEFRMVIYDPEKDAFVATCVKGAWDDPNHDLFWAVSGGGGGNFGIATQFSFKTPPYKSAPGNQPKSITQFSATWSNRLSMNAVLEEWMEHFPTDDEYRLTTFCRLIAPGTEASDQPTLILGNFIGEQAELETNLKRLLPKTWNTPDFHIEYTEVAVWPPHPHPLAAKNIFTPAAYQPAPPTDGGSSLSDTCKSGAYFRHKISSAYPLERFGDGGPAEMVKQVNATAMVGARRYISLHCLGGVVKGEETNREKWSSFAYRHKPFLIQYQAWWYDEALDATCKGWVDNFRDQMKPYTEGAFINFPDRDRVATKDPVALMEPYYGTSYDRLRDIKTRYDPEKIKAFDFPMGIPRR
ncbi:MAG TPA: FAD-binding protein [Thermoanaerobaculia bacterium]|jgi:hypothetical protein